MKSLALRLSQYNQFDMNISFPLSGHEGILEALEKVGEGEGPEFIIVNGDPVLPNVTFQRCHDFDRLLVFDNLLVGDVIPTSSYEVVEDLSAQLAMV